VHAAVGAIEEHYQIKYQAPLGVPAKTFSVQQGLDCLHPEKLPKMSTGDVYKFFMGQGGLATKKAYPDTPDQGTQCLFTYAMDGIQILGTHGYERIDTLDEEQLKRAVV